MSAETNRSTVIDRRYSWKSDRPSAIAIDFAAQKFSLLEANLPIRT
jgi:hypothetical protein